MSVWRSEMTLIISRLQSTKIDPLFKVSGGGGEIRTLGGLSPSLVFKTSAFNRSATPPEAEHVTQ